ncbi:DUF5684 domain-containing protein [Anaerofustis stercorihominis]|uniref:DUF5684 domain-containing protein n=1 Tax=Anaerofustis stercorihominis TaxID=214853 RepID=UPI00214CB673|nr:DUF5684 domain-containing protein [Anaerofustis stercorihominis]MCR2033549.1 DUF5684 domain-containing protein [Anaerofustis stercorihominis]
MYFEYMNIINNAVYYICDYAYAARNLVLEYLDMLYSLYLIKFGGDMGLTSIDIGWSSESMFDIISFGKFFDFIFIPIILPLIILLIILISRWKIFDKAGEAGWKALIPFYGTYTLCKITFGFGWYMLLFFIPYINLIMYIITYIKLGKKFGKGKLFILGLTLFTPIFLFILAFGKSKYLCAGVSKDKHISSAN